MIRLRQRAGHVVTYDGLRVERCFRQRFKSQACAAPHRTAIQASSIARSLKIKLMGATGDCACGTRRVQVNSPLKSPVLRCMAIPWASKLVTIRAFIELAHLANTSMLLTDRRYPLLQNG